MAKVLEGRTPQLCGLAKRVIGLWSSRPAGKMQPLVSAQSRSESKESGFYLRKIR
jgi:hypothetical protein